MSTSPAATSAFVLSRVSSLARMRGLIRFRLRVRLSVAVMGGMVASMAASMARGLRMQWGSWVRWGWVWVWVWTWACIRMRGGWDYGKLIEERGGVGGAAHEGL